jgi:hypothetical protein
MTERKLTAGYASPIEQGVELTLVWELRSSPPSPGGDPGREGAVSFRKVGDGHVRGRLVWVPDDVLIDLVGSRHDSSEAGR